MSKIKDLAEQPVNLTVKEVNESATILKDEYGNEPAAVAEKTEFWVILKSAGAHKLNVIKEVKSMFDWSLQKAIDYVDSAPTTLVSGVSKDEANRIKAVLEGAGAQVDIE